ncbi:hypothetical protein SFRURICE_015555 [Spodoptera frugiperda]|nr:hypothetical protein SFRURICE_015555 [Spodoptera frugiperda]
MNKEEPRFNRCCFCFPLRYGLLVWGNVKISVAAFFITTTSYALLSLCLMFSTYGTEDMRPRFIRDVALTSVGLGLFILDFCVNIVFIVRGYKKSKELIRFFYYYSIAVWVLSILLTALAISFSIEGWLARYLMMRIHMVHILNYFSYFAIIIVQTYFLLLLNSEITKLNSNTYDPAAKVAMDTIATKRQTETANDSDSHSSGIPTQPDNVTCGDVNSATSSMARLVSATSVKYINGISTAILIIFLIILSQIPLSHSKDLNIVIMIIVVILTEVVVHCGFIVGVHKKAVKIMRLYFYYALFMWSVTMMAAVVVTGLLSVSLYFTDSSLEIIIFTTTIVAFALSIAVQTFLLLALRSEIIKLRSNCPYRFVKDDNEPEGTITPVSQNIDLTSTNSTEPIQEKMAF